MFRFHWQCAASVLFLVALEAAPQAGSTGALRDVPFEQIFVHRFHQNVQQPTGEIVQTMSLHSDVIIARESNNKLWVLNTSSLVWLPVTLTDSSLHHWEQQILIETFESDRPTLLTDQGILPANRCTQLPLDLTQIERV